MHYFPSRARILLYFSFLRKIWTNWMWYRQDNVCCTIQTVWFVNPSQSAYRFRDTSVMRVCSLNQLRYWRPWGPRSFQLHASLWFFFSMIYCSTVNCILFLEDKVSCFYSWQWASWALGWSCQPTFFVSLDHLFLVAKLIVRQ